LDGLRFRENTIEARPKLVGDEVRIVGPGLTGDQDAAGVVIDEVAATTK
jgi:hypothetical protein